MTPRVLSVAGTDPTGGAGIQADLKSIAAHGGYGMAVVTALVAQNTCGVREVHRPPAAFLDAQLRAVSDDVEIDAVKIGMLADVEVVRTVTAWLDRLRPPLVVLDPVMVATSGDRLLAAEAEEALVALLPRADLVTPNVPELAVLAGEPPATSWSGVLAQAQDVAARHGVLVLAKGGHLDDEDVRDAVVGPDGTLAERRGPRVATRHTHGTGCSMSSALATLRARGESWPEALEEAGAWLAESLRHGEHLHVGQGRGPVHHLAGLWERGGLRTAPDAAQVLESWWHGIADLRAATDDLPFVRDLGAGTLEPRRFAWYLAQDAVYLRGYARALALAASLAPTTAEQVLWAGCAREAIEVEMELHRSWLARHDDAHDGGVDLAGLEAAPTTAAYVDHLLAAGTPGGYPVLVAALLPCFWLYADVGERLAAQARPEHPYAAWLDTYADEGFATTTERAKAAVGAAAAAADEPTRAAMARAFRTSAAHEVAFFSAPMDAAMDAGTDAVSASGPRRAARTPPGGRG